MTTAIDRPIQQQPLSFDEFLDRYGGDNRYELIDGEVFDRLLFDENLSSKLPKSLLRRDFQAIELFCEDENLSLLALS